MTKVYLMAGLNEPTHRKKWLVHLHDLEAHDHRVLVSKLGGDVCALLAEIDDKTAVVNFVLCPHLVGVNQRQVQATSGGTTVSDTPLSTFKATLSQLGRSATALIAFRA